MRRLVTTVGMLHCAELSVVTTQVQTVDVASDNMATQSVKCESVVHCSK